MVDNPRPDEQAQQPNVTNNNNPLKGYAAIYKTITGYEGLSDGAFRTYATLLGHDLGNGVFPSIDTLARERGISHRAAQAHVLEIRRAGLVTVTRRGLGRTNVYEIVDGKTWAPPAPDVQISAHQQIGRILHIKKCNDVHMRSADFGTSHREETVAKKKQKKEETVGVAAGTEAPGADKPRRPPCTPIVISTVDDPNAPAERSLALGLAREVFGAETSSAKQIDRYEVFMRGLLDVGRGWDELWDWFFWMDSGRRYWRGNSRIFSEDRMLKDLSDWDARGQPKAQAIPGMDAKRVAYRKANGGEL